MPDLPERSYRILLQHPRLHHAGHRNSDQGLDVKGHDKTSIQGPGQGPDKDPDDEGCPGECPDDEDPDAEGCPDDKDPDDEGCSDQEPDEAPTEEHTPAVKNTFLPSVTSSRPTL